jgi:hypothetical protein
MEEANLRYHNGTYRAIRVLKFFQMDSKYIFRIRFMNGQCIIWLQNLGLIIHYIARRMQSIARFWIIFSYSNIMSMMDGQDYFTRWLEDLKIIYIVKFIKGVTEVIHHVPTIDDCDILKWLKGPKEKLHGFQNHGRINLSAPSLIKLGRKVFKPNLCDSANPANESL